MFKRQDLLNDEPVMGSWEPVNQHGSWDFPSHIETVDIKKEIAVIVIQLWITCGKVPVLLSYTIHFLRLN